MAVGADWTGIKSGLLPGSSTEYRMYAISLLIVGDWMAEAHGDRTHLPMRNRTDTTVLKTVGSTSYRALPSQTI